MTRKFVLVTVTKVLSGKVVQASGIKKLKTSLEDFIDSHVSGEKIVRGETTVVNDGDSAWNFTVFEENDIIRAVSFLTREELIRDIGDLLPLKVKL